MERLPDICKVRNEPVGIPDVTHKVLNSFIISRWGQFKDYLDLEHIS